MSINLLILIGLNIPRHLILPEPNGSDRRIPDYIDFIKLEGINRDVLG